MSSTSDNDTPKGSDSDKKAIPAYNRLKKSPGVPRIQRARDEKYQKNIEKRGNVTTSSKKKKEDSNIGPWLIGFFVFVVVGSSLFQIIRQAQQGLV